MSLSFQLVYKGTVAPFKVMFTNSSQEYNQRVIILEWIRAPGKKDN